MSTRSRIGIQLNDGTVKSIYCHHDGYKAYVGEILKEYYTNPDDIEKLVALGDISSLYKTLEETAKVAYGDSPSRTDKSYYEFYDKIGKCGEEFTYIFMEDYTGAYTWHCAETPYFDTF